MQVYNYDPVTFHYTGESAADPSPRPVPGHEWIIPANATTAFAPPAPAGCVAKYDPSRDAWDVVTLPAPPQAPSLPAPPPVDTSPEGTARAARDALLRASDWVVIRAYETGEPVPPELAAYRQALRDVPSQEGFPLSVEWPTV